MNRESKTIASKGQALLFTEEKLLPTILTYWKERTLRHMTVEAKEALQKLWSEHMRPGATYMISCPDCPAMGLDTIGTWYCKAHGFPPSVAVIQAGIDGTLDELKKVRDTPVILGVDKAKAGGDTAVITETPLVDPFAKLPVPEVEPFDPSASFIPPVTRPAVKDDQPTKPKK